MIIWIASYPKSGNTWVRALLSYYFFSKEKGFNFDILKHIPNFNIGDFVSENTKFSSDLDYANKALNVQKFINKNSKFNVFFKTHSALRKIVDKNFTDKTVSLGSIYIIRDPRNIISSYKNFENWDYDKTLEFMINKNSFLYSNTETQKKLNIKGMELISSWSENYKSWVKNNLGIPICLIKYEDLINNTLNELEKMFNFIKKINSEDKINFDKERGKLAISETNFQKLKKLEENNGFAEKNIRNNQKFFFKGADNDWNKILPKNIKEKIESNFYDEMLELEYLK